MNVHDRIRLAQARKLLTRPRGATVREIAAKADRSARAVRRWIPLFRKEGVIKLVGEPIDCRYRLFPYPKTTHAAGWPNTRLRTAALARARRAK